jgi:hypothetical protein
MVTLLMLHACVSRMMHYRSFEEGGQSQDLSGNLHLSSWICRVLGRAYHLQR